MDNNIKYIIENIISFNPVDYNEESEDIINSQDIDDIADAPSILANEIYNKAQIIFKRLDNLLISKIKPLCISPFKSKQGYYGTIDMYDEYQYFMFPTIAFITNYIDISSDARFILYEDFYYNEDKQKKQEFKNNTILIWKKFFKSLELSKRSEITCIDLFFSVEIESDLYKETYIDPNTHKEYCIDIQGFYKLIKNFFSYIKRKYKSSVSCEILDDEKCHIGIPFFQKKPVDKIRQNLIDIIEEKIKLLINIFNDYVDFLDKHLFEYIEVIL